jgi:hypothetical protein
MYQKHNKFDILNFFSSQIIRYVVCSAKRKIPRSWDSSRACHGRTLLDDDNDDDDDGALLCAPKQRTATFNLAGLPSWNSARGWGGGSSSRMWRSGLKMTPLHH